MRKQQTAQIGSISSGTLRSEDLIDAFADELERIGNEEQRKLAIQARSNEQAAEYVEELIDALNECAPAYCYFGSLEGDGADFGFWPDTFSIEELPHVADSDEAKQLGEDCKFVNDHGNVTVFDGNGNVVLELV